jgi:hypothetical protein
LQAVYVYCFASVTARRVKRSDIIVIPRHVVVSCPCICAAYH